MVSNVLEVTNNRDAIDEPRESFQVWLAVFFVLVFICAIGPRNTVVSATELNLTRHVRLVNSELPFWRQNTLEFDQDGSRSWTRVKVRSYPSAGG